MAPKKILRLSDAFVTHTHMDHFSGFDRVLRICLGRDTALRLYGPPGFIGHVGHKLAAYTWNLVENYPADFCLLVHEVDPCWQVRAMRFRSHARFEPEPLPGFEAAALRVDPLFDFPLMLPPGAGGESLPPAVLRRFPAAPGRSRSPPVRTPRSAGSG